MVDRIVIRPGLLSNFGEQADCMFAVLTAPRFADLIQIDGSQSGYRGHTLTVVGSGTEAHDFIQHGAPAWSHILVILPDIYFQSPEPDALKRKKLGVMACFSTPTSVTEINHFLRQAEKTAPGTQRQYADFFFSAGESSTHLELRDDKNDARAVFNHLSDELMWHEQVGPLEWGEQQLLPSGEISVLPVSVFGQDIDHQLDISGELVLAGIPIVHAGSVSFLRSDQARIYDALSSVGRATVVLSVERGIIKCVRSLSTDGAPAARYLNMLCEIDSRYTSLVELGFGCNFGHELLPSNSAMNEVHGASSGALHLGIGLLPYTQYHIDVICPATRVRTSDGRDILGPSTTLPFLSPERR